MNNLDIVRACYQGFADSTIDTRSVGELFHPDITFRESPGFPYGGTFHGVKEVFEHLAPRLAAEWSEWNATPERFVADGDHVVVIGTYRAQHRETGAWFETRFAHHYELEDGRVVRYEQITDSVPIREAMQGA